MVGSNFEYYLQLRDSSGFAPDSLLIYLSAEPFLVGEMKVKNELGCKHTPKARTFPQLVSFSP
ncbi:hypothetical protein BH09BAC4_BH09BAC4_06730 [soil metagenome]